jgi:hypothetical protein
VSGKESVVRTAPKPTVCSPGGGWTSAQLTAKLPQSVVQPMPSPS